MRIFKAKSFARFCRQESIADEQLCDAVSGIEVGLSCVNLGSGLFKVRMAGQGKGKSGGYRSILIFWQGHRAVFVHGFAKRDADNLAPKQVDGYRQIADAVFSFDEGAVARLLKERSWTEVIDESKAV